MTRVLLAIGVLFSACAPAEEESCPRCWAGADSWADSGPAGDSGPQGDPAVVQYGTPEIIAWGQPSPWDLAVDATHVYWIHTMDPQIKAALHDGSSPFVVATGADDVADLAVDETTVFYIDGYRVMRVAKGGGTPVELTVRAEYGGRIAIDGTHVYWSGDSDIGRVPKAGGSAEPLVTGLYDAGVIAVDESTLYFPDAGDGTVRSLPKAGGPIAVVAFGQNSPRVVYVDDQAIYWGNEDAVMKAPKSGGAPVALVTNRSASYWDIDTDATQVYYPNTDHHTIERVAKGGGPLATLATGQGSPKGLKLSGTTLFWVAPDLGTVVRLVQR